jgi:hypothetical protein
MFLVFRKRVTGELFGGRSLVKKPIVALLYAQQFLDESREVAWCAEISLTTCGGSLELSIYLIERDAFVSVSNKA